MNLRRLIRGTLLVILAFYALLLTITVHVALGWSGGYLITLVSFVSFIIGLREMALGLSQPED